MPKQTFFNLSEDKRQAIIEVSIDEFSRNSFKNASISKIVERANIAKGSLYQYFHDKKDLYKYIFELSGAKKFEYLVDWMHKLESLPFMDLIRELYVKGIEFAIDNPELAAFASNFLKESDVKFKEEIMGASLEKSNQFFEELIEGAKLKGQVHPKVDTKMGAHVIISLNNAIVDYMLTYMKYEDIIQDKEVFMDEVDKMLLILKHGFNA